MSATTTEAEEPDAAPAPSAPDLTAVIERFPLVSSNLASAGYDADTETLEVAFQTRKGVAGPIYRYGGVPRDVFAGLLTADSKGEYFDREVKRGGYPFRRVSPIFDEPVRPLGEGA